MLAAAITTFCEIVPSLIKNTFKFVRFLFTNPITCCGILASQMLGNSIAE